MLKAAIAFKNAKLGVPILVGKEELIKDQIKKIGYNENFDIEIINSKNTSKEIDIQNTYLKNFKENRVCLNGIVTD